MFFRVVILWICKNLFLSNVSFRIYGDEILLIFFDRYLIGFKNC